MTEWNFNMDEAPRDGTPILAYYNGVIVPARWRASRLNKSLRGWHLFNWSDLDIEYAIVPTHWMHLPNPPKEQGT